MTAEIHATHLRAGRISMLHMHRAITRPSISTPAMRWGTLVHAAILEPAVFSSRVAIWSVEKRGRAWSDFRAAHGDWAVSADENERLGNIASAVSLNRAATELLSGGRAEVPLKWSGVEYGAAGGRVDYCGDGYFLDLKTSAQIDPRNFARSVAMYGYDVQLGWYAEGLAHVTGSECGTAYIIAIESAAPHDVAVYRMDAAAIQQGRATARAIAARYRLCEAAGKFAGQVEGVADLALPQWYYEQSTPAGMPEGEIEF